jgi:hypothetical protein
LIARPPHILSLARLSWARIHTLDRMCGDYRRYPGGCLPAPPISKLANRIPEIPLWNRGKGDHEVGQNLAGCDASVEELQDQRLLLTDVTVCIRSRRGRLLGSIQCVKPREESLGRRPPLGFRYRLIKV